MANEITPVETESALTAIFQRVSDLQENIHELDSRCDVLDSLITSTKASINNIHVEATNGYDLAISVLSKVTAVAVTGILTYGFVKLLTRVAQTASVTKIATGTENEQEK